MMFTQNINQTQHVRYDSENEYFMLYYQFIKHAFGLRYCNPDLNEVRVAVLLDDAPDTVDKLDNFKNYLSGLSDYPAFHYARIRINKSDITEVNSKDHVILQAVDVILGSIQFRLNEMHRAIPAGKFRRGKRTRAKERVYKHILSRLQDIYPNFNIGNSTGCADGLEDRWRHPCRHWCFIPTLSVKDLSRGKRVKK